MIASAAPAATLIARLIGPLFATLGLGMLLNAAFYAAAVAEGARYRPASK
jgi:hypothetical protein